MIKKNREYYTAMSCLVGWNSRQSFTVQ